MNNTFSIIAELRERVEYLEEELRRKDEQLHPKDVPLYEGLRLTNKETLLLEALIASRNVCTREHAMNRLYRSPDEEPDAVKILDVFMHKLRAKLREIDVQVETIWGRGWRMPEENRAKLVPVGMPDPFVGKNMADQAKATRDAAAQETAARDARIEAARKARETPKKPPAAYPWPKPVWNQ